MRADLDLVARLVPPGTRVLDLGCGDGELCAYLIGERGCVATGIERDPDGFLACVARGVPVLQADIDQGLASFGDASFDVVILSHTLQATHKPALVLREVVRVGQRGIVSLANFGYWRYRARLAVNGRIPVAGLVSGAWHDTPNIHSCTIHDFEALLRREGIVVKQRIGLNATGGRASLLTRSQPNLLAQGAVYLISPPARSEPARAVAMAAS